MWVECWRAHAHHHHAPAGLCPGVPALASPCQRAAAESDRHSLPPPPTFGQRRPRRAARCVRRPGTDAHGATCRRHFTPLHCARRTFRALPRPLRRSTTGSWRPGKPPADAWFHPPTRRRAQSSQWAIPHRPTPQPCDVAVQQWHAVAMPVSWCTSCCTAGVPRSGCGFCSMLRCWCKRATWSTSYL